MIALTTLAAYGLPIAFKLVKDYVDGCHREKLEELRDKKRLAKETGDIEEAKRVEEEEHRLQLELEREAHIYRSGLIEKANDEFVEKKADEAAIKAWPLSVMPFVMTGQGFGSAIRGCRNVAVHAFMAPSNSTNFNKALWHTVDSMTDRSFALYSRMASRHRVCYYGNAWRDKNTDALTTGNQIEMVHTKMQSLPLISVRPLFADGGRMLLQIRMSCVSGQSAWSGDVVVPESVYGGRDSLAELLNSPIDSKKLVASNPEMAQLARSVSDYVAIAIGYLADMYYWDFYHTVPCLPTVARGLGMADEVCGAAGDIYFETGEQVLSSVSDTGLVRTDALSAREYLDAISPLLTKECKAFLESNVACGSGRMADISVKAEQLDSSRLDATVLQTGYTEYRDILVGVLDKVSRVRELTPEERGVFDTLRRRLVTDEFNIVLIGEFQGGKSTTFNALCGGREISPRGKGIKTSAICITATALADKDAEEYTEITWKTDRQLLESISAVTCEITAEDLNVTLKEGEVFDVAERLNLRNPLHMEVLHRCIVEQLNMLPLASDRNMILDQIRLAIIIHRYYSDMTLLRLKERTRYGVDDVARFVVFPDNWTSGWHMAENSAAMPAATDVTFAFIESINVYIHSKALSRLGCSITDCPGLFASSYDTVVAMRAMARANAIIYLLNGEKEMGEVDERVIRMIGESGTLANRTFFAVNERANPVKTQNIINQDKTRISDILGHNEVSISPYNALLYFLSGIGGAYTAGRLDGMSEERFMDVAEKSGFSGSDFGQAWQELVESVAYVTRNEKLKAVDGLTAESVEVCADASGGSTMMDMVNASLLKDRAPSIIVDNGVNRVCRAVDAVNARLTKSEADAAKTAEQKREEADAARKAIKDFEESLTAKVAVSPYTVKLITDAAYVHEITSADVISEITLKLALKIPETLTFGMKTDAAFNGLMEKIMNGRGGNDSMMKKRFNDKLGPVVKEIIGGVINHRISVWTIEMNEGRHDSYVHHIKPMLETAAREIAAEWQKEVSANPDLGVFSLTAPDMTKPVSDVGSAIVNESDSVRKAIEKAAVDRLISDVVNNIVCLMTGIVIGCLYDLFITGGIGTIFMAIYSAFGYLIALVVKSGAKTEATSVNDLKRNERKLYSALYPELSKVLSSDANRESIVTQLREVPDGISANFLKHFSNQLKGFRAQLDKSLEKALSDSLESTEKLRHVAEQARRVRMLEIYPLVDDLNAFISTLRSEAGKA